jgi:DNA-binding CsgD family transcriptional regulator
VQSGSEPTAGDWDALLRWLTGQLEQGGNAVVVDGEAGIGKSTLLAQARDRASADRRHVVTLIGRESERHLPFAALSTIAGDLESSEGSSSQKAPSVDLGLRLLDRLNDTAQDDGLLLCIDDAQWLDEVSAEVLAFVLRRLGPSVSALITARTGEPHPFADIPTVRLGGVDHDTALALLSTDGSAVNLDVAQAAHRACGGNPLALLELGRILTPAQRAGTAPLPDPVPVGAHLRVAMGRRLVNLPEATQRAVSILAIAGELDRPTVRNVLTRLHADSGDAAIGPAEQADVVTLHEGRFRFTHPLLRSAAAAIVSPLDRRATHRALASLLPEGDDRRAWHLADAADGPSEEAEAELRALAQRADERGAFLLAALAATRAADVSTSTASAAMLLRRAGEAYWNLARPDSALPVLDRALRLDLDPLLRANVRATKAHVVAWTQSTAGAAEELVELGRATEEQSAPLSATSYVAAAVYSAMAGDADRGVELADEADRVAAGADELTAFGIRAMGTFVRLTHGDGPEIASGLGDLDVICAMVSPDAPRQLFEIAQLGGFAQIMQERWDDAATTLTALAEAAHRHALDGTANFAHAMLAEVAIRRGQWTRARAEALADVTHDGNAAATVGTFGHASLGRVDALLGLTASARTNADLALRQAQGTGMAMLEAWARHAVAIADLIDGDTDSAVDHLAWIAQLTRRACYGDPGPLWWQGDYVEALLTLGRLDDVRRFAAELSVVAERHQRRFAQAIVARAMAVLDRDLAAARRSIELLDALGAPFEAARSRLVLAELSTGGDAVHHLEVALGAFEHLGAAPWERRTRAALARAGEVPAPSHELNVAALLSPREARVALSVAQGRTNLEAAQELYLSVKTVESHLSSVYRKLGVRTRTELAVLLARAG